jgi:hypothetical protein
MATDAAILAALSSSGGAPGTPGPGRGAFSAPLQEPAQFVRSSAQLNYEITELARRDAAHQSVNPPRGETAKGSHLRGLACKTPTKEDVLEEFRRADLRPLWLGRQAYLWSAGESDRAKALKELKNDLVREDLVTAAGRLDQFIVLYWVARLLGWDEAQDLRVGAIRELRRLVARNGANEEFALRRHCERPARALWARMVRDHLTAAAVKAAVDKIRPSRAGLKVHGRAGAVAKTLKAVGGWRRETDLVELIRVAQERLTAIRPTSAAVA